jgi:hypothetical protein
MAQVPSRQPPDEAQLMQLPELERDTEDTVYENGSYTNPEKFDDFSDRTMNPFKMYMAHSTYQRRNFYIPPVLFYKYDEGEKQMKAYKERARLATSEYVAYRSKHNKESFMLAQENLAVCRGTIVNNLYLKAKSNEMLPKWEEYDMKEKCEELIFEVLVSERTTASKQPMAPEAVFFVAKQDQTDVFGSIAPREMIQAFIKMAKSKTGTVLSSIRALVVQRHTEHPVEKGHLALIPSVVVGDQGGVPADYEPRFMRQMLAKDWQLDLPFHVHGLGF